MSARGLAVAVLAALGLAACNYHGNVENPIVRKATWFSYVGGEDIKRECVPGAPPRYRFVYNAQWEEQVRTYEVRRGAPGTGALLTALVFGGGGSVASFDITDPLASWRGSTAERRLSENEYLALVRAVEASGFGQPAPEGLTLSSWGFYWAVSACANGQFHFNAWRHPSDRFAQIRFTEPLFAYDTTGVAVNPPRPLNEALFRNPPRGSGDPDPNFDLRVGNNGLAGTFSLF